MRCLRPALLAVAFLLPGHLPRAAEPSPAELDEKVLKRAGVGSRPADVARFFRARTLTDDKRKQILGLIEQLRDNAFPVREKAQSDLEAVGDLAIPQLRQAMVGAELELVRRAEKIIASVELTPPDVAAAAARQFARQNPGETAAVLLAYLPTAPDDAGEDIRAVLASVAVRDGKQDKALLQALETPDPLSRAAAAEAFVRAGSDELRRDLHRFLKDKDAGVQLRVALALVQKKEKAALPVLIALLTDLPLEQAYAAEEVLYRLADDRAPMISLGKEAAARKKCQDAWQAWFAKHGDGVDLAKVADAPRLEGFTLVVQHGSEDGDRVMELGPDNKVRWQVGNLQYAVDGQFLPGKRFLVAEHSAQRVTERNFKGEILWEKKLPAGPITCQRLTNGNTLIATHIQVLEFDPTGKEVFTYNSGGNTRLCGVYKPRNGPLALLTSEGTCIRIDANGKETMSFKTAHDPTWVSGFEVLPSGRLLIPSRTTNKVIEYDADGKVVWQADAQQPKAATRLANGHTLVSSFDTNMVIELDRAGKVVWEYKDSYSQYRARRR
ncbi:MAG: PQQ-binding-like beta-propeller repeat protein [Gemmataceae bacterium]|nr:PQQ-binding-like beta-propeller repeat protein [Gemmataceae bacterium]